MTITMDSFVSEIIEAFPEAEAIFEAHGVMLCTECAGVLDNPLDLCETMCHIDDIEGLLRDLQALAAKGH